MSKKVLNTPLQKQKYIPKKAATQQTFTCSKPTIETLETGSQWLKSTQHLGNKINDLRQSIQQWTK